WKRPRISSHRPAPASRTWLRCEAMEERAVPGAGSLDPNFGVGGKVILYDNVTSLSGGMIDRTATMMPDGSMYVVGSAVSFDNGIEMGIEHYTSAGVLDINFGSSGRAMIPFSAGVSRAHAAVVQPDGKIVAAGSVSVVGSAAGQMSHLELAL